MSNRQSNIIFYSIIFLIISIALINNYQPSFFDNFTKSKEEFLIKEAMSNREYDKALASYQDLLAQNISQDNQITADTAAIYEEMAKLYFLLDQRVEEKNYYLKSLAIKQQLKKVDIYSFAKTYYKLATLAEEQQQYQQAQSYYEKSLWQRIGNLKEANIADDGLFVGMQQSRIKYLRLNHPETIATYRKLAAIHQLKQENSIAKEYYQEALTASKLTFGEDDPKTIELVVLIKQLSH